MSTQSRFKVCNGPSHDEPVELLVNRKNWYFHKTGRRAGTPVSRCKTCCNWNRLKDNRWSSGLVEGKLIQGFARELALRCGGSVAAARYSKISRNTMGAILNGDGSIQVRTAQKIFLSLKRKRYEDRRNNRISKPFMEDRAHHARIEERLEREISN